MIKNLIVIFSKIWLLIYSKIDTQNQLKFYILYNFKKYAMLFIYNIAGLTESS